jgi:hypothetical protein
VTKDCTTCKHDCGISTLLPAALDDLFRLTTAMHRIATLTESYEHRPTELLSHIDEIAHAALDGTAPKGG